MRKNLIIALVLISAAIIFMGGCSNRGERIPTAPTYGADWAPFPDVDWAFRTSSGTASAPPQLLFQLRNPDAIIKLEIYLPKIAMNPPYGEGLRVPLLILLAPEGESQYFYSDRGLYELYEEMAQKGEIKPMAIATIGNDPTFGGYFYGNSYPAGQYDAIIGDTALYYDSDLGESVQRGLLSYFSNNYPGIFLDSPDKRGIGGVGQGAYGAFRTIFKSPYLFNSISVADGPLSFNDGLRYLFTQVAAEQQTLWENKGKAGLFEMAQLDTLPSTPLTKYFVGGALAFSPNDTAIDYTIYNVSSLNRPDSVKVDAHYRWTNMSNPDTSNTLCTSLITAPDGDWDFHMPFDNTGLRNDVVWNRWMDNDLGTLMDEAPADALSDVNIFIATSIRAKWYYHEMTEAWISNLGANVDEVYRYDGYLGNPGSDNQYTYDLLKRMLKFHSDNFETN